MENSDNEKPFAQLLDEMRSAMTETRARKASHVPAPAQATQGTNRFDASSQTGDALPGPKQRYAAARQQAVADIKKRIEALGNAMKVDRLSEEFPAIGFQSGKVGTAIESYKIESAELLGQLNSLANLLTDSRMAEEMDASSHSRQLRSTVERVSKRSSQLAQDIRGKIGLADRAGWRSKTVEALGQASQNIEADIDALKALSNDADLENVRADLQTRKEAIAKQIEEFCSDLSAITTCLDKLGDSTNNRFKMNGLFRGATAAAEEIGRSSTRFASPIVWALATTMATAYFVVFFPGHVIPTRGKVWALFLVFLVAFFVFLRIEKWMRARTVRLLRRDLMSIVQRCIFVTRDGINHYTASAEGAANWKLAAKLPKTKLRAISSRNDRWSRAVRYAFEWPTKSVVVSLFVAASVLTAYMTWPLPSGWWLPSTNVSPAKSALIGETRFGERCTIAEGHYVDFAEGQHILAAPEPKPLRASFFPRAFGQRFSADTVVAVQPASAVTGLARCVGSPPPDPLTSIVVEAPVINLPEWRTAAMPDCRPPYLCDTSPGVLDEIKEINGLLQAAKRQFEDHLTQQPNAPDVSVTFLTEADTVVGPLFPHLFTHIVVPEGEPPLQLENNQFLVFAPGRVEDVDNRMDLAFKKGIESIPADLDEGLNSAQNYQLLELLQRTEAILVKEVEFHLRVTGFASDEWENLPVGDDLAKSLNHALAEGRRAGVLRFLANALGKDKAEKLMVRAADGPCVPLSTWATVPAWEDYKLRRFDDHADMTSFRVAELESLLDKTNSEILRRQLQRVVRVDFNSVTACEV